MNYNMHGWDNKSLGKLHAMLKIGEKNVPSKSVVPSPHMIRDRVEARQANKNVYETRTLEKDVMVLHMGNGNRAEDEAIGFYFLNVPSGMKLYKRSTPNKLETHAVKYYYFSDSELVVEEDNPTNVVEQAPPQNQENDVTPVLRISGRASHPLMRYYGHLIDSDVRDLRDHEEPKT
ncbi:hypothetical protein Tco_1477877 [Tanacetum coccineum]